MANIQSIFIPFIKPYWTPELIASYLYESGIALSDRMEVYNSTIDEYEFKSAVIEINQWSDTEDAYEFICSLKFNGSSVLDVSDEYWIIYKEPKAEHLIDLLVGEPSVTYFNIQDYDQYDSMAEEMFEDDANMDEIEKDISNNQEEENEEVATVLDEEEYKDLRYVYDFDELEMPSYPEYTMDDCNNYYQSAISTY
jgi:hypothetical protein